VRRCPIAHLFIAYFFIRFTIVAGIWHVQSVDSRCLVVPRAETVLGTCSFVVTGPLVWNSLPANIHCASASLQTFARRLKTYLLNCRERK